MRTRYPLGLALATLLVGCLQRPAPTIPPAAYVPPEPTTLHASLADGFITVDVTLPPGHPAPRPVVLSPAIDRDLLLAAGFALADYRVHWELLRPLRPPPKPSGAPAKAWGKWLLASPSPATVGRGYFGLIDHDVRTAIPAVLDHLATVPELDVQRVGITGNSTRGFTALQALAEDRRIGVAAVTNACGDYHAFLADSPLGLDGAEPLALAPDYDAWLLEREPIRHAARLPPAALLLVNGERDHAIPIDCARRTAHVLAGAYARAGVPDHFRAVVLPGRGHEVDPDAVAEVLRWLVRWLEP